VILVREISASFKKQAKHCRALHCDFYGQLLELCAEDYDADGPVAKAVASWHGDPLSGALALRLMGAIHRWVLMNNDSPLKRYYSLASEECDPKAGDRIASAAWKDFRDVLAHQSAEIRKCLALPPQTNDVQRSSALLLGFLTIERMFGVPLSLHEIGASAGLNMYWDSFHYDFEDGKWGDERSTVRIRAPATGVKDILGLCPQVVDRKGCDIHPLQLTRYEHRITMESYFWPTPPERLALFRAAANLAAKNTYAVEQANAARWTIEQLRKRRHDSTFVLYHSALWPYLSLDDQQVISRHMERAGGRSSTTAPVAWLALEYPPGKQVQELELTVWPGGEKFTLAVIDPRDNTIAYSTPHGYSRR
jgi:hypothetical protein